MSACRWTFLFERFRASVNAYAMALRVADLKTKVAVPAFAHGGRNADAFAREIVPHSSGVGGFESYLKEAAFVFRLQSFVHFEVLVVVDFEPSGWTETLRHGESVGEAEVMGVETARGGDIIGLESDMGTPVIGGRLTPLCESRNGLSAAVRTAAYEKTTPCHTDQYMELRYN